MLPLKLFKQSTGFCGPTSLRMVLAYYGEQYTEENLAQLSGATPHDGCGPLGLVQGARALGFGANFYHHCNLGDLEEIVKVERIPAIVDWLSPLGDHYSVITEIGPQRMTYADPYDGRMKRISRENFWEHWLGFYHYPPREMSDILLQGMIIVRPKD